MFEHYERQGARSGHSVPRPLTKLSNPDGTHPIVHLEHMGETNGRFRELCIARAGKLGDVTAREWLSCCATHLENVYRADGSLATDADLPAFIEKIPLSVVTSLVLFAQDESNFCEYPVTADPKKLAEK